MMDTEQVSALRGLESCIEHHNQVLRRARELWGEAEEAAQSIGRLVSLALSTGTSWAELGRLLATVDEAAVPAGLKAQDRSSRPSTTKDPSGDPDAPEPKAAGHVSDGPCAPQTEQADPLPEQATGDEPGIEERALEIVRGVSWPSGIEVGTLRRALAAEGRPVTEGQARGWFDEWSAQGQVQRVDADRYLRSDLLLDSPTLATGDHAPLLLRRAHQILTASPKKEMATRELAAALNENVQIVGGELCSMLREVGVPRPNRGRVTARYGGETGPRLPGFTAETLGEAIAIYNDRGACATRPGSSPRVPEQAASSEQLRMETAKEGPSSAADQGAQQTGRERALEIVEDAGVSGMTHSALIQQLDEEKHLVTGPQLRSWLMQWTRDGTVRQLRDGSYMRAGRTLASSAEDDDTVPLLLLRALDAVRDAGGVMSSKSLFTVLQRQAPIHRDAADLAGQVVGLLRKVETQRPNRGMVRVLADHPRMLGFTAATLEQAVNAYKATARR
ncbi:hypothetical protein ACQEVM_38260 [Streptomyces sp. CA-243310]|uniref:hypothetical protein n=1 Tax=Streptomyces sp. CA-243310 TaxID=3240056 RepID=UPI003D8C4659